MKQQEKGAVLFNHGRRSAWPTNVCSFRGRTPHLYEGPATMPVSTVLILNATRAETCCTDAWVCVCECMAGFGAISLISRKWVGVNTCTPRKPIIQCHSNPSQSRFPSPEWLATICFSCSSPRSVWMFGPAESLHLILVAQHIADFRL